jgi:hypothetical protein
MACLDSFCCIPSKLSLNCIPTRSGRQMPSIKSGTCITLPGFFLDPFERAGPKILSTSHPRQCQWSTCRAARAFGRHLGVLSVHNEQFATVTMVVTTKAMTALSPIVQICARRGPFSSPATFKPTHSLPGIGSVAGSWNGLLVRVERLNLAFTFRRPYMCHDRRDKLHAKRWLFSSRPTFDDPYFPLSRSDDDRYRCLLGSPRN